MSVVDTNCQPGTPVLVVYYREQGEAPDMLLVGEWTRRHTVTITGGHGVGPISGTEFDWSCSCGMCSEGLPNGDCWPTIHAAEQDAVRVHHAERMPLITHPAYVGRDYPGEEPF